MKKLLLIIGYLFFAVSLFAQVKVYDEKADAVKQINEAVYQANKADKYVLVQVGGNWCPWCLKFAEFAQDDSLVSRIVKENYIYIHVNWSKANKNPQAMKMLENPARFGFPVFVILDEKGKRIHTQNSAYLEEGKEYSEKKVVEFLTKWTKKAINDYSK